MSPSSGEEGPTVASDVASGFSSSPTQELPIVRVCNPSQCPHKFGELQKRRAEEFAFFVAKRKEYAAKSSPTQCGSDLLQMVSARFTRDL